MTEETFPVEITEDGQTIEITIENQIIKGIAESKLYGYTLIEINLQPILLRVN